MKILGSKLKVGHQFHSHHLKMRKPGQEVVMRWLSDGLDTARGETGSYWKRSGCSNTARSMWGENKTVNARNLCCDELVKEVDLAEKTEKTDHRRLFDYHLRSTVSSAYKKPSWINVISSQAGRGDFKDSQVL